MSGINLLIYRCLKPTEWNKLLKTWHIKNKKCTIWIHFNSIFQNLFISQNNSFYLFQMPWFFTFLNTRIWWGAYNQAVAPGITRPIWIPLVVTTTDLMFRKIFKFLWFDKLHVEVDLMWFSRKLWWFLFVGYLNKCWVLLQNSNCSCATTLSLLVIVSFSVTATCALDHSGLETKHFHGHDCRNSGRKIANLDLCTERHLPQIFLRLVDVTHFIHSSFLKEQSTYLQ